MGLFHFARQKRVPVQSAAAQSDTAPLDLQAFILEPILTPSGLVDAPDHTPNVMDWVDHPGTDWHSSDPAALPDSSHVNITPEHTTTDASAAHAATPGDHALVMSGSGYGSAHAAATDHLITGGGYGDAGTPAPTPPSGEAHANIPVTPTPTAPTATTSTISPAVDHTIASPASASVVGSAVTPPLVTPAASQPLVGIIDTGFAAQNAHLDYSHITLGHDYVDGDNNPLLQPGRGNDHGTGILGIVEATQKHGVEGLPTQDPLWLGRATGSGHWADSLVEFVDHAKATGHPHAVVNFSFDLTQINPDGSVSTRFAFTPQELAALNYAHANHVLIVAAAGNQDGAMSALGQASQQFDNIMTVGAADGMGRAAYSSYGAGLDLLANGGTPEHPLLTTMGDSMGAVAGSSAAAAQVTGAVSLVWQANPDLSYRQVIELLEHSATDVATAGWDATTGFGVINLAAAINLAKQIQPEAATVSTGTAGATDNFMPIPWATSDDLLTGERPTDDWSEPQPDTTSEDSAEAGTDEQATPPEGSDTTGDDGAQTDATPGDSAAAEQDAADQATDAATESATSGEAANSEAAGDEGDDTSAVPTSDAPPSDASGDELTTDTTGDVPSGTEGDSSTSGSELTGGGIEDSNVPEPDGSGIPTTPPSGEYQGGYDAGYRYGFGDGYAHNYGANLYALSGGIGFFAGADFMAGYRAGYGRGFVNGECYTAPPTPAAPPDANPEPTAGDSGNPDPSGGGYGYEGEGYGGDTSGSGYGFSGNGYGSGYGSSSTGDTSGSGYGYGNTTSGSGYGYDASSGSGYGNDSGNSDNNGAASDGSTTDPGTAGNPEESANPDFNGASGWDYFSYDSALELELGAQQYGDGDFVSYIPATFWYPIGYDYPRLDVAEGKPYDALSYFHRTEHDPLFYKTLPFSAGYKDGYWDAFFSNAYGQGYTFNPDGWQDKAFDFYGADAVGPYAQWLGAYEQHYTQPTSGAQFNQDFPVKLGEALLQVPELRDNLNDPAYFAQLIALGGVYAGLRTELNQDLPDFGPDRFFSAVAAAKSGADLTAAANQLSQFMQQGGDPLKLMSFQRRLIAAAQQVPALQDQVKDPAFIQMLLELGSDYAALDPSETTESDTSADNTSNPMSDPSVETAASTDDLTDNAETDDTTADTTVSSTDDALDGFVDGSTDPSTNGSENTNDLTDDAATDGTVADPIDDSTDDSAADSANDSSIDNPIINDAADGSQIDDIDSSPDNFVIDGSVDSSTGSSTNASSNVLAGTSGDSSDNTNLPDQSLHFFLNTLWQAKDGDTQKIQDGAKELSDFFNGFDTNEKRLKVLEFENKLLKAYTNVPDLQEQLKRTTFIADALGIAHSYATLKINSFDNIDYQGFLTDVWKAQTNQEITLASNNLQLSIYSQKTFDVSSSITTDTINSFREVPIFYNGDTPNTDYVEYYRVTSSNDNFHSIAVIDSLTGWKNYSGQNSGFLLGTLSDHGPDGELIGNSGFLYDNLRGITPETSGIKFPFKIRHKNGSIETYQGGSTVTLYSGDSILYPESIIPKQPSQPPLTDHEAAYVAEILNDILNNSVLNFIKPVGNFIKPLGQLIGEFIGGAIYEYLLDVSAPADLILTALNPLNKNVHESAENSAPKSWAFEAGRAFGDGGAILTGILQFLSGVSTVAGGGEICLLGILPTLGASCIGGGAAAAIGAAWAIAGVTEAKISTDRLVQNLTELFAKVKASENNGNDENSSSRKTPSGSVTPEKGQFKGEKVDYGDPRENGLGKHTKLANLTQEELEAAGKGGNKRFSDALKTGNNKYGGQLNKEAVQHYAELVKDALENGKQKGKNSLGQARYTIGIDIKTGQATSKYRVLGAPHGAHIVPGWN